MNNENENYVEDCINEKIANMQSTVNDISDLIGELRESFESSEINTQDLIDDFANELEDYRIEYKEKIEKLSFRLTTLEIQQDEFQQRQDKEGAYQTRKDNEYKFNNEGLENLPKGAKYLGHPGERKIPESPTKAYLENPHIGNKPGRKICKKVPFTNPQGDKQQDTLERAGRINVNLFLNELFDYKNMCDGDIATLIEVVQRYNKETLLIKPLDRENKND